MDILEIIQDLKINKQKSVNKTDNYFSVDFYPRISLKLGKHIECQFNVFSVCSLMERYHKETGKLEMFTYVEINDVHSPQFSVKGVEIDSPSAFLNKIRGFGFDSSAKQIDIVDGNWSESIQPSLTKILKKNQYYQKIFGEYRVWDSLTVEEKELYETRNQN